MVVGVVVLFTVGVIAIGLGLHQLMARGAAWQLAEMWNRQRGLASERTPEWERAATVSGVLMVCLGLCSVGYGLSLGRPRPAPLSTTQVNCGNPRNYSRFLTVEEDEQYRKDPLTVVAAVCSEARARRR